MVISGGSYRPDTLKPTEVVSLLIDDAEMQKKCESLSVKLAESAGGNVFNVCVCKYKIGWENSERMFSVEMKVVNEFSHVLTCNSPPTPIPFIAAVCVMFCLFWHDLFLFSASAAGGKEGGWQEAAPQGVQGAFTVYAAFVY